MQYFFERLLKRCTSKDVTLGLVLPSFVLGLLALVVPVVMLQTYDRIIPNQSYSTLSILILIVLVAMVLEVVLKILRSVIGAWADSRFEHLTGTKAYNTILDAKLKEFDTINSGAYLDKLSSIGRLKDFYTGRLIIATVDLPFIFIFILMMAYIAGWLALIPVVMLVVYGYFSYYSNLKLRSYIEDRQLTDDKRTSFIIESLTHIQTLKANAIEEMLLSRYDKLLEKTALADHKIVLIGGKKSALTQFVSQTNLLLIVGFGALLILNGMMSLGALAASSFLANRIMQPVSRISGLWTNLQTIKYAEERLESISALDCEVHDSEKELTDFKGKIEFKDIELVEGNKVNLTVNPGEIIAIAGETLSGKTHLMMMLEKMTDIPSGHILLDGQDLSQFSANSVRKHIQYVSQTATIYNGTLLENITLFRDGEYIDRAYEMCKELGLETFIQQLPYGYDTLLGQSSVEVIPKGVKQKINIARALTSHPKAILFDAANSAFDDKSNYQLMQAIERHRGEYTIIFVTTTYSQFIEKADRALLLVDGELNEYTTK